MPRRASTTTIALGCIAGLVAYAAAPPASREVVSRLFALAGMLAVWTGIRLHRPAALGGWRTLAAGYSMFLLGDVLDMVQTSMNGGVTAVPGFADLAYFVAYPLLLAGSVRVRSSGEHRWTLGLDTAIVAIGACVLAWPVLVAPTLSAPTDGLLHALSLRAYPIADLVLLAATVRLALHRSAPTPSSLALTAAFGCQLVADAVWQHQLISHGAPGGPLFDLAWIVGGSLLAFAALHPSMAESVPPAPGVPGRLRTVGVAAALLTPPVALLIDEPGRWGLVAAWLALVGLVVLQLRSLVQGVVHGITHDPLTGVQNRAGIERTVDGALQRGPVAVVFCDLHDLRTVNTGVGYSAGDELLRAVAARLVEGVRPGDVVARVGGAEFAVACPGVDDPATAARIAQRVRDLASSPFLLADVGEVAVSANAGVAIGRGVSAGALLRDADVAMTKTRSGAPPQVVIAGGAPERDPALQRLRVASGLRRAVPNGELVLHYQPQVSLADGGVIGFEALLRWNHPERGLVPPLDFIPAAETSGEIIASGAWALDDACAQVARWQAEHPEAVVPCTSVNVSARQLADPGFPDTVLRAVRSHGIDPSALCLEVTETSVVADVDLAVAALSRVKRVGVSIAIDDFGTGHSSLSQLRRLPVDQLKIDRSFVTAVDAEAGDRAIVRAIVSMAHALGMRTVAEGIETEGQLHVLRALGCDYGQGFLLARPAPSSQVARFLDVRVPLGL